MPSLNEPPAPAAAGAADRPRVIVITGPVGAGKTTIARAVSELLGDDPRHVLVDMDALRQVTGWSDSDPFWTSIGMGTFAELWRRAREVGARLAVIADVIEHPDQRADFERALPGAEVTIVRLDAPMHLVLDRLRHRMSDDPGLEWHLTRAPELHDIMTTTGVGDLVIDVGERSVAQVATEVLHRCALLTPSQPGGTVGDSR